MRGFWRSKPPLGVQFDRSHPLSQGLRGYWPLNEGAGVPQNAVQRDTTSLVGAAEWRVGADGGRGIYTNAVTDYANLGSSPLLRPPTPLTLLARFRIDSLSVLRVVFGNDGGGASAAGAELNVGTTGAISAQLSSNSSTTALWKITAAGVVVTGQWYTVVAVMRSATDMNIYVDGADVGGTYAGTGTGLVYANTQARIGSRVASSRFLSGICDLAAIWARGLTATEAQEITVTPYGMFLPPVWRRYFIAPAAGGDQTLALVGLDSAERAGAAGLGYAVSASGLGSAETFGVDALGLTVAPIGAGASERAGAASLGLSIAVAGVGSAERIGSASVGFNLLAPGIGSAELPGTIAAGLSLVLGGLPTAERLGAAALGALIQASGISSFERPGNIATALSLALIGLVSDERFGVSPINPGPVVLTLAGIASAETPGVASLAYLLAMAGIGSEERAGVASLGLTSSLTGLGSAERSGVASIGLLISPSGLISVERFGSVQAAPGAVALSLAGLGSSEMFGASAVTTFAALAVALTGLGSAERAGIATVSPGLATIGPAGIPSSELFGQVATALNLAPAGIGSEERQGSAGLSLSVLPASLGSAERAGTVATALGILLAGLNSEERSGLSSVNPGPVTVVLIGLPSGAEIGLAIVAGFAQYAILTVPLSGAAGASRRAGLIVVSRTGGRASGSERHGLAGNSRAGGLVGPSRKDGEYP